MTRDTLQTRTQATWESSGKAQVQTEARRRPLPQFEQQIIKTLLKLTNEGKAKNTIHAIDKALTQLSNKTNLNEPETIKNYVATATHEKTGRPLSPASKTKMIFAYEWYCKANEIPFQKPRYKIPETIPIIPTTDQVTKIISASTKRYTTIFTLMAEIGVEGEELHQTSRNQIDTMNGTITIIGHKGHGTATYKLKQATAEMLREYLAKNPEEYPFPQPCNKTTKITQKGDMPRNARERDAAVAIFIPKRG